MLYNEHDGEIKFCLLLFMLFMFGICYVIETFTNYSFYKYLEYIKSKLFSKLIFGLHWIATISFTLTLPIYLAKYNFYNDLIKQSLAWEYIVMLISLFIILIAIGFCINLVFFCRNLTNKKPQKSGSR